MNTARRFILWGPSRMLTSAQDPSCCCRRRKVSIAVLRRNLSSVSTAVRCLRCRLGLMCDSCLLTRAGISYDDFIRTTEPRHKTAVHHLWKYVSVFSAGLKFDARTLESKGHLYAARHAGWYCVADESFLTPNQVTDAPDAAGAARLMVLCIARLTSGNRWHAEGVSGERSPCGVDSGRNHQVPP
jgi:hypothetical protein